MEKELKIGFGAMVLSFSLQLKQQGFKFDRKKIKKLEKLNDYLLHLMFNDIITRNEFDKCRKRFINKIKKAIIN